MPKKTVPDEDKSKLCPFQVFAAGQGGGVEGWSCIGAGCQLWVPNIISEEDVFTSTVGSNNRDGKVDENSASSEDNGRCGLKTSDLNESIFRLTHHLHRHHKHSKAHLGCAEIPTGCGDPFLGDSVPKSIKLVMEFESNEDQDGNTKIFGKDFGIIEDEDTPLILKNLIDPSRRPPTAKATWENIRNDKFPPYVRSIKPSTVSKSGGIWVRVTGAFFSGNLESFEIKLGDPDNDIPYVDVTEFTIIDFNKLYFLMPSDFNSITEAKTLHLYMKNFGNTFDFPLHSLIFNSGGEAVYKNRIKIKLEDDDPDLKQQMLDEYNEDVANIPPEP